MNPMIVKMNSPMIAVVLLLCALAQLTGARIAEELLAKEAEPQAAQAAQPAAPAAPAAPAPAAPPPPPPLPAPPPPAPHSCFSATRASCPPAPAPCASVGPSALLCCDVDAQRLDGLAYVLLTQDISYLHILNATLEELDVSLSMWRRLISISVTDGSIKHIKDEFKKISAASCLNISNNGLLTIAPRAFVNLFNLTTLDISSNNLTTMPHFNGRERDFALDIKGNIEMGCPSVLDAYERYGGHLNFINVNTTFCVSSKNFHWFNSTELVPIRQIEVIHELNNDCPEVTSGGANCSCYMVRVDIVQGKPPTFSVGVDCSNRHLKELPKKLPPNTIHLNVSYNNITSLAPLSEHNSYEHMRVLNADYNEIKSIIELEGTKFIDNFMVLSLRANKLKSLPTYILSDTFDRNWFTRTLNLSNNYFHCDCTTAKVFKVWLLDKRKYIPDYDEIFCENLEKLPVIDLVESKMCQQQRDWTDYIYYVIATEALLLLGLITKVSYDYWVFKTAGYLPWPASKMPKLPCDWLCE